MIMGTTGAGKTTIGTLLAAQLNWQFADADTFHPLANIDKMSHGIPLNDADRASWHEAMPKAFLEWIAFGKNFVFACSALKRDYRNELCFCKQQSFREWFCAWLRAKERGRRN